MISLRCHLHKRRKTKDHHAFYQTRKKNTPNEFKRTLSVNDIIKSLFVSPNTALEEELSASQSCPDSRVNRGPLLMILR